MSFNSRQYEWGDMTLVLGGRDVTGFRGIKYTEKGEKEPLFAKGRHAHSIQTGNITVEGEITVLQSELIALEKAGNGSVIGLNVDAVVAYGNPSLGDAMTTDRIVGISFTEAAKEMKQGDKNMEITIPFIALAVVNQA
ncbi:hypothetical protein [Flavobacterium gilvum]|uniref:Tail tube protein n=1 Tax=Flavobacterium gilvum TaxID=1492737 RepID=A0AAC9I367_9FLAO|nr:hypothetical protein [Flavobacterium gilvum]AOW08745.1 hypothetical protein EM308_04090 [Flavobacterium gilvum]KFC59814.1 hypothetical protein FEM08_13250 [Flavobacterium gilvum]